MPAKLRWLVVAALVLMSGCTLADSMRSFFGGADSNEREMNQYGPNIPPSP
ncbi:MAG: hypothetical protein JNK76_22720 [Planctomycetales bacterium]|nr:hypothetical protein [Planctomycetales bacterium]MBN8629112.1 hypothetical protein [Planctomycetota bacterium]